MAFVLFPGDGDVASPDISWSYGGFGVFREWLARAEGFDLSAMDGFGGACPWSEVSTTLIPLLDHPDDAGPNLTPTQCARMLPRLEQIARREETEHDPLLQRHIDDARQLVTVLRFCIEKNVDLLFA
jgi:hypothetical protein